MVRGCLVFLEEFGAAYDKAGMQVCHFLSGTAIESNC